MAWADIWQLKQTETAECIELHKVSISGIAKEINRINASDNMAVVATMMERMPDTWLRKSKEDTEKYQAYDALIFYRKKKNIEAPTPTPQPVQPQTAQVPTVDLNV